MCISWLITVLKVLVLHVLESPNVQVDEEGQKVRPNHKRCIVILREIPDNTPLDDVKVSYIYVQYKVMCYRSKNLSCHNIILCIKCLRIEMPVTVISKYQVCYEIESNLKKLLLFT